MASFGFLLTLVGCLFALQTFFVKLAHVKVTLAYEYVCIFATLYLTAIGCLAWTFQSEADTKNLLQDHHYGRSFFVENYLCVPVFAYQVWNLGNWFLPGSAYGPEFLMHHLTAATLAYLNTYPYLQYYAIFFSGLSEFSTVFMCIFSIIENSSSKIQRRYADLTMISKGLFAVTFLIFRVVLWSGHTLRYWNDTLDLLSRPEEIISKFSVYFFLAASVFLTGLQFIWGYYIWKETINTLKKKK